MQDKGYLLSIEELLNEEPGGELFNRAVRLVDSQQCARMAEIKNKKRCAEILGGAMLLQLAVQEALGKQNLLQKTEISRKSGEPGISSLEIHQLVELLEKLPTPLPLEYYYGKHGKPYLKNYPYFFNISHSGKYVCCALSEEELGVDIQQKKAPIKDSVGKRFFREREIRFLEQCGSEKEKLDWFYRLWCRKEAWGKLTGQGILSVLEKSMLEEQLPVSFWEWEMEDDYQITICKSR